MSIASYTNWAGNVKFCAARLHQPTTVAQVQEIVRHAKKIRPIGSRHSFNLIADCDEDMLSLDKLEPLLQIDRAANTVTLDGGMTYGRLNATLHQAGFALPNLASLPHITVSGACATATHGSGDGNGNLATAVSAIQFVGGDGELHTLSRAQDGDRFCGAVVALGALGVITQLTLNVVPAFEVRQEVYSQLPLRSLYDNFAAVMSSAYSVSLFTDYGSDVVRHVWLKRRIETHALPDLGPTLFGAKREPAESAYDRRMGSAGVWYERLPHFLIEDYPGEENQLQAEYFVPRRHAAAALAALDGLRERIAPLLYISEIRSIAADDLWLSPCYGQPCLAFHFTWKQDIPKVQALLPEMEARLAQYEARPHWGKLFAMSRERIHALYPRLPDFQALMKDYDPEGKFRNAFLERCF